MNKKRQSTGDSNYYEDLSSASERYNKLKRGLKVGAAVVAIAVFGPSIADRLDGPTFSEELKVYNVMPGDSFYSVINEIDGIETVSLDEAADYIANLDENRAVVKDGLQPDEQLLIPTRVED